MYILADKVHWHIFEEAFLPLYCRDNGRPAKPIRLMVGLLILKHIRDISDESVVEQWSENVYCQYFCGENTFVPGAPCESSQLVHFRKRTGESGVELILKESMRANGDDANDDDVNIDTTVQEKDITFPADSKLHRKIIRRCGQMVEAERLPVRQTHTRTLRNLPIGQRFRDHPGSKAKARRADEKVKTIAGRLVGELDRNLPPDSNARAGRLLHFKRQGSQKT